MVRGDTNQGVGTKPLLGQKIDRVRQKGFIYVKVQVIELYLIKKLHKQERKIP
jgi:IS5 family transposase